MTASEKAIAVTEWNLGNVTLDVLAKRYGKSVQAIQKMLDREGAVKGSTASVQKEAVTAAIEQVVIDDASLHAQRVRDTHEEHYKLATMVGKLIANTILKARQEGRSQGTAFDDHRALVMAMNGLTLVQKSRERALGIDQAKPEEDKPLPTLGLQEVTDEQVAAIQAANKVTNETDVTIAQLDDEMKIKP
jgi:hypothetical protein